MPAVPGNVLGSPRPCLVPQISESLALSDLDPWDPVQEAKAAEGGSEAAPLPAWVTCPHCSLLVHWPTLSCPNSPKCSSMQGPRAKEGLIRANESSAV